MAVIGPVFTTIENAVIGGVQQLITLPFGIGSFVMGGLYATTVVSGIHHMYTIIDLGQLAQYGLTYWLPLASACNVAQGGAAQKVGPEAGSEAIGMDGADQLLRGAAPGSTFNPGAHLLLA